MKQNLIHIKLEHSEAVQSKKDVLASQMHLLKIAQTIKKYRALRSEELKSKLKLQKKIKEISANIKKLQVVLPKIEVPSIIKKPSADAFETKILKTKEKHKDASLESQLQEIQEKLRAIQ